MAWDLTCVRRGTSDDQGCDGLKVKTYGEPGQHGLRRRSRNVPLRGSVEANQGELPISEPWKPRLPALSLCSPSTGMGCI